MTPEQGPQSPEEEAPEPQVPEAPGSEVDAFLTPAEASCAGGVERATELPLPAGRREVAVDAEEMAAIVADVREQIASLEAPHELQSDVDNYLGELAADEELLREVAAAAAEGGDFREPLNRLDESAGEAARVLGLQECVAFANVVARTP